MLLSEENGNRLERRIPLEDPTQTHFQICLSAGKMFDYPRKAVEIFGKHTFKPSVYSPHLACMLIQMFCCSCFVFLRGR